MKTNYHTHTYLCKHAIGKPIDYIERAINLNYDEIAITDHGPLTDEVLSNFHSRRMNFDEFFNNYLFDLEESKNKYSKNIKIITGLEIEYFDVMKDKYQEFLNYVDMLVIGQHYIYHDNKYKSVYALLTDDEIKTYGKMVTQAMETGLFKIIAHPDIFAFRKKWNSTCDEVAKKIIFSAKQNNVYIEFNANGIRNSIAKNRQWTTDSGEVNYDYPRLEFFKLVKEANVPVIINDDAHEPNHINDQYTKMAVEMAQKIGLTILNKIN